MLVQNGDVPARALELLDLRVEVYRIDAAQCGSLDELVKYIVDHVLETGLKVIDRVSRRWSIEITSQPDGCVLKLSPNGANTVDALVVAVETATHQLGWVVGSCSPRFVGENTSKSSTHSKAGCSRNAISVSVSTTVRNESTEALFCRAAERIHLSIHPAL